MKAINLALVALAGFGLVTSEVASADTLPGNALPTVGHVRASKLVVRQPEKRRDDASSDSISGGGLLLGLAGATILGVGIYEATTNTSPGS